jgi:methyl-accepting chemotaxis protein
MFNNWNSPGRYRTQFGGASRNLSTTGAAINQTSAAVEQLAASIARISEASAIRSAESKDLASLSKTGQDEMVKMPPTGTALVCR